MKVGDLVRFYSEESDFAGELGIVTRVNGNMVYVQWALALCKYGARQLEIVSESR